MKFHKATLSLLSSSFFLTSNLFCTSVAASASTALRGVGDAADADADVDIVLADEKRGVFLVVSDTLDVTLLLLDTCSCSSSFHF